MAFPRTAWIAVGAGLLALGWIAGCTAVLGIDKDYYDGQGGAGGGTTTTHHGGGGGTGATGGGGSGPLANGEPCTAPGQCEHHQCVDGVCCESSCPGVCKACAHALTGHDDGKCENIPQGDDPESECPAGLPCDGEGHCFKADGQSCTADSNCLNDHCPHGMCCHTTCDSDCESCEHVYTGQPDGTCADVTSGLDPYNQCNGNHKCDGSGNCN